MTVETEIMVGDYTADGTYKVLQLPAEVDHLEIHNYTKYASTATPGVVKRAWWFESMPDDSYMGVKNTDGSATDESVRDTSNGFRQLVSSPNSMEAAQDGSAITDADPAVATVSAHGYSDGDTVLITGSTGMLQIAGMEFTIDNVSTDTFELPYLDASGFAAAATDLTVRRVSTPAMFTPRKRFITGITQASEAVVTLSVTHGYSIGDKIKFNVPEVFGMTQINGKVGKVTAFNTTNNTVTVNIDSTAFDAFAFPASGEVPFSFAEVTPHGSAATSLSGAVANAGFRALRIGSAVDGADGDAMKWIARRSGFKLSE